MADKEFHISYRAHDWQGVPKSTKRVVQAANRKEAYAKWVELTEDARGREFVQMTQVVMRAEVHTEIRPKFL